MAITKVSNAAVKASVDAVLALLNVGGAGSVEVRTGVMPSDVDTAATGTLLGTVTLSATAFGAAIDGIGKASATANAIGDDTSADAAGTAAWFRAYSGAGTAVIDGDITVTGGGGAITMDNINVALNDTLSFTSWLFEQSEG